MKALPGAAVADAEAADEKREDARGHHTSSASSLF
jgi:hypothetical protein